ncbi:MAG: penicillin acylase family protein [Rhodospirillum sp.]|nr:penicillin acylase family protein [Rhodospirillum sp.]MCF8490406.1 penicillin acylase family protein [Rhodospirillum sp.]MCF8500321.1 penicillin acylase family protein [Rhodospirillum sp.]
MPLPPAARRSKGRLALTIPLALLALILALTVAFWLTLTGSLPKTEGRIDVPIGGALPLPKEKDRAATLGGPLTIARDNHGIPTIRASSATDAAFGLGFVHAQDRLWQMESMRRLGAGRLSEVMGAATLSLDRYFRTLGLYNLARETFRQLPDDARRLLESYTAGVNHFLKTDPGPLPPEFLALAHRPEPWTPADSLVWGRLMGIWLTGDWQEELIRAALFKTLNADQMRDLWPALALIGPSASLESTLPREAALALAEAVPDQARPFLASNAWALTGERTASGKPLLANDPHLGFQAPTQWYLVRLETPESTLMGASAPGTPYLPIGQNGQVAWGFTTTHSDTSDLFIEKIVDREHYLGPDGPTPWRLRQERIDVRFGEPENLTVRATQNGVVISDALLGGSGQAARSLLGPDQVIALASTALRSNDTTALAMHRLNQAKNAGDIRAAARLFQAPQQNLIHATRDGYIGRLSPGLVPLRSDGPGLLPQPGWTGINAWTGYIPFDELPATLAPRDNLVLNTNSRITDEGYPYYIAPDWPGEYRAARLRRLLNHKMGQTVTDQADYQMDTVSEAMTDLLPLMLDFPETKRPPGSEIARAHDLLATKGWMFDMTAPRVEPLVAAAWTRALVTDLFADEMGAAFPLWDRIDPDLLVRVLKGKTSDWCDDVRTAATQEDCGTIKAQALTRALTDIRTLTGGANPFATPWGRLHVAHFDHALFHRFPIVNAIADLSIPTGGSIATLSKGTWAPGSPEPFSHFHGATLRAVMDLDDPNRSGFILPTGQSGHPLSPHYRDMLVPWRDGDLIRLDGRDDSGGVLRLTPDRD